MILVLGMIGILTIRSRFDPAILAVFCGLGIGLIGVFWYSFLVSFLGPVFWFDLIQTGRKTKRIWFRMGYAILLVIFFLWVCATSGESFRFTPNDIADLTRNFFSVFILTQTLIIFFVTPSAIAGCISDEKERRTLEFILTTDLNNREILFGKFLSRVLGVIFFVLAGLPILAMLQFFGGIDPDLMILSTIATLITILSLASIAVVSSVWCRRSRDAILLSYLIILFYIIASSISYVIAESMSSNIPQITFLGYTLSQKDFLESFAWGNPFTATTDIFLGNSNIAVASQGQNRLKFYAIFHLSFIVICLTLAVIFLRRIALAQAFGNNKIQIESNLKKISATPAKFFSFLKSYWRSKRPMVGENPVLWKEVFIDTGIRSGWVIQLFVWLAIIGSFIPCIMLTNFYLYQILHHNYSPFSYNSFYNITFIFQKDMNNYSRFMGAIVATMLLLGILVRASGVISTEKDRQTLDVLLSTPLSSHQILWGKWWGCLLGMRWGFAWVFLIWLIGVAAGGSHPLGFLICCGALICFAGVFAWLGIFCSVSFRSSLYSTLVALMSGIFLLGGYFIVLGLCCFLPLETQGSYKLTDFIANVGTSFSPPVALVTLTIEELYPETEFHWKEFIRLIMIPFAFLCWLGLGKFFLTRAKTRFRKLANRSPLKQSVSA
ncbi:MAG: ABC transporter permease [Gemmataceae bacterium]|nr:ABC transporter permease [Gemmataceae bacterium]